MQSRYFYRSIREVDSRVHQRACDVHVKYSKVVLEQDASGNQKAWNINDLNLISRRAGTGILTYMYNGHADVTALLDSNATLWQPIIMMYWKYTEKDYNGQQHSLAKNSNFNGWTLRVRRDGTVVS